MKRFARLMALSIFVAAAPAPLSAFPDGAPWGSADPDGAQSCASCHYFEDAVQRSDAILVTGLPDKVEQGKTYSFSLSLVDTDYATMGFLMAASRGQFVSVHDEKTETHETMARSTAPKRADDEASYWTLEWAAPAELPVGDVVTFNIAINASNDDASPFGDVIHYRTIQTKAK